MARELLTGTIRQNTTTTSLSLQAEKETSQREIISQFEKLFLSLEENAKNNTKFSAQKVMEKVFGFCVSKAPSTIPGSGFGKAEKGQVISLYPGTTYYPMEGILFASFNNNYMLRRSDGITIDGKPTGLSKKIFLSSAKRENFGNLEICDSSWILKDKDSSHDLEEFKSPIATGHSKYLMCIKEIVINHRPNEIESNVMYFEVDFPFEFPVEFRKYLPNVHFVHKDIYPGIPCLKAVSAVALRRIENEELFSDYCFIGRQSN